MIKLHRRFNLVRHEDVTGLSGTGIVAEGVAFSSGKVCLEWIGKNPTSVVWHDNGIASTRAIHGHNGLTEIHWVDKLFEAQSYDWGTHTQGWYFSVENKMYAIYLMGNELFVTSKSNTMLSREYDLYHESVEGPPFPAFTKTSLQFWIGIE